MAVNLLSRRRDIDLVRNAQRQAIACSIDSNASLKRAVAPYQKWPVD